MRFARRDPHRARRHRARRGAARRRSLSFAVARTDHASPRRHHRRHARGGRDRRPDAQDRAAPGRRWDDEDAQLLATTFNTLTDSIARFQREVAQRERLSSLGRLSTVIAHEVRNPLMIIKGALRTLAATGAAAADVRDAAADIDEEVVRLNRLVNDVLDFARPIRFELAPTDLNALCRDAAAAAGAAPRAPVTVGLAPELPADHHRRRAPAHGARQPARPTPVQAVEAARAAGGRRPALARGAPRTEWLGGTACASRCATAASASPPSDLAEHLRSVLHHKARRHRARPRRSQRTSSRGWVARLP